MKKTKIAFLYSEVAGYFLACVKSLVKEADVLIVRWPVNSEAPFKLPEIEGCTILTKTDFDKATLIEKVQAFDPTTVICSGWMDRDYLNIVKTLDKKVKRVLSLDNHWTGNPKQQIARLISPFYLKRLFSHAWVPGTKQQQFAKKLGFGKTTLTGFYCADTALFNEKFENTFPQKKQTFPKRFLYVARYVKHKGIFEMWEAFKQLQNEAPNDWELFCLGTGAEWENRVEHEKIKHIGFVQPSEMDAYMAQTGVYILPSKFEPWGVSVQEFAVGGFPLLLSEEIAAAETFLKNNGISFKADSVEALKKAMKTIIALSDAELVEMGEKSHVLGMQYTPADWTKKIVELNNN